jgi:hypothetical protein
VVAVGGQATAAKQRKGGPAGHNAHAQAQLMLVCLCLCLCLAALMLGAVRPAAAAAAAPSCLSPPCGYPLGSHSPCAAGCKSRSRVRALGPAVVPRVRAVF